MRRNIKMPTKLDTWFVKTNHLRLGLTEQSRPEEIRSALTTYFNDQSDEETEIIPPETPSSGTNLSWFWNWSTPFGDDNGVGLITGRRGFSGTLPQAFDEFYMNYDTVLGTCPMHSLFCKYWANHLWMSRNGWTAPIGEAFIVDTMNYIVTGRRMYTIDEWYGIMKDKALGIIDKNEIKIITVKDETFRNLTRPQLFKLWTSREGGIRDVIVTHQFLFRN